MRLAGIVLIDGDRARRWRVARREIARRGIVSFIDAAAFRVYSRLLLARGASAWSRGELDRLRSRYPVSLDGVPSLRIADPNDPEAQAFIARLAPDLIVARCKFILKPEVFTLARHGAYAFHPGICPEYRNAHGCFWALAERDLDRVGMTLLRIDRGVDTGPVLLQATVPFDEVRESHHVIQGRVVFENLDRIGTALRAIARGETLEWVDTTGRTSNAWGQPRLSSYIRWKLAAHRDRRRLSRHAAVS